MNKTFSRLLLVLAFLSLAGCAAPTATLETIAAPTNTPTQSSVPTQIPTETATPSATPLPAGGGSGLIIFDSNRGGSYADIFSMRANGSGSTRLTQNEFNSFAGPLSPDGTKVLFTGFGLIHSYIGVMNIDGSHALDLSQQPDSDEGFPTWSPDGTKIAFTSRRDGNNEVYLMNADGTNPLRLTHDPRDDFAPSFSPDGKKIAFVSDRNNSAGVNDIYRGLNNIYVMNVDGTNVTPLTSGEIDYTPVWSPDGTRIVFRSSDGSQSDIFVINADGSGRSNLTHTTSDEWSPSWSPDGTLIAFQTNRDGNWEIYVMQANGSSPVNLTNNAADDQRPYWH